MSIRTVSMKTLGLGFVVGCLVSAGALWAQAGKAPATAQDGQPFDIVDTPGSTYLLNKSTGQVWRLSFTDVGGNKYWYGMYAPMEPPSSFEEFRARVRKELGN
jgi:hypothetical protein